jgi:hypothetical protein
MKQILHIALLMRAKRKKEWNIWINSKRIFIVDNQAWLQKSFPNMGNLISHENKHFKGWRLVKYDPVSGKKCTTNKSFNHLKIKFFSELYLLYILSNEISQLFDCLYFASIVIMKGNDLSWGYGLRNIDPRFFSFWRDKWNWFVS